jgi:molybdopterin/thiamine biosynthesis adenylyltransferase
MNTNYYSRQLGLANPETLTKDIGIIGAGAIGSWATLALVKMGCQKVKVYDFDIVGEENIGSQLYSSTDVGKPKVQALQDKISLLTEGEIRVEEVRIREEAIEEICSHDFLILAVDNIETRKLIFNFLLAHKIIGSVGWAGMLIDARMAGNALEVYTIPFTNKERVEHYKKTLFTPEEASPVLCSMRSVVYNVFIVGGLIADIVAQLSRGVTPPEELVIDLTNFTMYGGLENG